MNIEPITREEKMLDAVANGTPAGITPITREEMFLAKAGGSDVTTPEPVTRKEIFLSQISGGGSVPDGYADVSGVTAVEADVLEGKKFVDAAGTLKTGTLIAGKTILSVMLISETPLGFELIHEGLNLAWGVGPYGEYGPEYLPDYCPLDEFISGMKIRYTDWNGMTDGDWERFRQSMTCSVDEYGDGMLTIRLAEER